MKVVHKIKSIESTNQMKHNNHNRTQKRQKTNASKNKTSPFYRQTSPGADSALGIAAS